MVKRSCVPELNESELSALLVNFSLELGTRNLELI